MKFWDKKSFRDGSHVSKPYLCSCLLYCWMEIIFNQSKWMVFILTNCYNTNLATSHISAPPPKLYSPSQFPATSTLHPSLPTAFFLLSPYLQPPPLPPPSFLSCLLFITSLLKMHLHNLDLGFLLRKETVQSGGFDKSHNQTGHHVNQ